MDRVLVCDDDITISEVVAIVLSEAKLGEVYTLPDCNNMIQKIETIQPAVIFMDNMIPDEGGIVATQIIKSHPEYKKIPVIYFTANKDIDSLAKEAGADYVLPKPFNITQLEDVVHKAFSSYRQRQAAE